MATVVGILDTKLKILSIQELISVRAPKETGLFYKKNHVGTLPWCSSDDNSWHKGLFIQWHLWNSTFDKTFQRIFYRKPKSLQIFPSVPATSSQSLTVSPSLLWKDFTFRLTGGAHTMPVSAGITLLLSLLTQSHELLVECHLPGTAHNRKPWQRLVETFGCYSSVNQQKLRE